MQLVPLEKGLVINLDLSPSPHLTANSLTNSSISLTGYFSLAPLPWPWSKPPSFITGIIAIVSYLVSLLPLLPFCFLFLTQPLEWSFKRVNQIIWLSNLIFLQWLRKSPNSWPHYKSLCELPHSLIPFLISHHSPLIHYAPATMASCCSFNPSLSFLTQGFHRSILLLLSLWLNFSLL